MYYLKKLHSEFCLTKMEYETAKYFQSHAYFRIL